VYERLGVGGMASVHRAKKHGIAGFQRVVALKRLLSHLADDQSFVESFVREARLASHLQHTNIIQIYDLGVVGSVYYIAMEYVRGRDLRQLLRQSRYAAGPPPIAITLALLHQLCDALDYAHSLTGEDGAPLGLIHRDISPANLLVGHDGHLKIIDFGIAKARPVGLQTYSGNVKGKFAFMAPETTRGDELDQRSDLFSTGIIAWELLTARPLFAARTDYQTILNVREQPLRRPSELNPDCPSDLDEIVLTALARDRDKRWASAGAMRNALDLVTERYGPRTTNRKIARWMDWAFLQKPQRLAAPPPSHMPDTHGSVQHTPAPATTETPPPRPEAVDDEPSIQVLWTGEEESQLDETAVRIVWGEGDQAPPEVLSITDAADVGRALGLGEDGLRKTLPPQGVRVKPRRPSGEHSLDEGAEPPTWAAGTPHARSGVKPDARTLAGMAPPKKAVAEYRKRFRQGEEDDDGDKRSRASTERDD